MIKSKEILILKYLFFENFIHTHIWSWYLPQILPSLPPGLPSVCACLCVHMLVLFFHCGGPSGRIQVARLVQQALLLTEPYLLSYFLLVIVPLSVLAFSLSLNGYKLLWAIKSLDSRNSYGLDCYVEEVGRRLQKLPVDVCIPGLCSQPPHCEFLHAQWAQI